MKKSTVTLLVAGILLAVSIIAYDLRLQASFQAGQYKSLYGDYVPVNCTGFDRARIVSAAAVNVRFMQGPFSVRVDKHAAEYTRIRTVDRQLIVEAVYPQHFLFNPNDYLVVISCPQLTAIETFARYQTVDQTVIDTLFRPEWNMRTVLVEGFRQDSLDLRLSEGSAVRLAGNTFDRLSAIAGAIPGSGSRLWVQSDNSIKKARIAVREHSQLFLEDARISDFGYQLADSASITVTGSAQHLLATQKQ